MVRSKEKMRPAELLEPFATMCRVSRAPDDDWQGDGWGIAVKTRKWEVYKSLQPIWEDTSTFVQFPKATSFVVHARSAGLPQHKGILAYNQPYVQGRLAFVFNGMIRGVSLPMKLAGSIGAQKIFSLIADHSLSQVRQIVRQNAKRVEGMNIGCVLGDTMSALCDYDTNSDYFSLRYYQGNDLTMICSTPIGAYRWKTMQKGEILTL